MEREEARRGGLSLSTSTRPGVEVERQSFFFSLLETRFSPLTEKAQPRSRKSTCTKLKVKTVNLYKRSGKGNRLEKAFPLESSCPPFPLLRKKEREKKTLFLKRRSLSCSRLPLSLLCRRARALRRFASRWARLREQGKTPEVSFSFVARINLGLLSLLQPGNGKRRKSLNSISSP